MSPVGASRWPGPRTTGYFSPVRPRSWRRGRGSDNCLAGPVWACDHRGTRGISSAPSTFSLVDMTHAHNEFTPDQVRPIDEPLDDIELDLESALEETEGWEETPDPEETTGEYDLAERHALRRVAGLSTEL